jgi:hypothetical protein
VNGSALDHLIESDGHIKEERAMATHSKTLHGVQRLRRLARRRRVAELRKARLGASAPQPASPKK